MVELTKILLIIYIVGWLICEFVIFVTDNGESDSFGTAQTIALGTLISAIWPVIIVAGIAALPFWLLYRLARFVRYHCVL